MQRGNKVRVQILILLVFGVSENVLEFMKEDLLSVIEKFPGKNIDVKLLLIDKNLIKIMK